MNVCVSGRNLRVSATERKFYLVCCKHVSHQGGSVVRIRLGFLRESRRIAHSVLQNPWCMAAVMIDILFIYSLYFFFFIVGGKKYDGYIRLAVVHYDVGFVSVGEF